MLCQRLLKARHTPSIHVQRNRGSTFAWPRLLRPILWATSQYRIPLSSTAEVLHNLLAVTYLRVPCLQEALNVLPNTATVKDTAALDEFQRVETERGVRPPPKKGLGEHVSEEANWKKVILCCALMTVDGD